MNPSYFVIVCAHPGSATCYYRAAWNADAV